MTKKVWYPRAVVVSIGIFVAAWSLGLSARQAGVTVSIDEDDLGGVVTSAAGPEAGVWVIAETSDLPTGFTKIVVTDDEGRYVLPDLPDATYSVWVRGYGLVDSPKVEAEPGRILNLAAVVAPNARAAAAVYPANYWYSLIEPPAKNEFPGTGDAGNGIPESMQSQEQFLSLMTTNGCNTCHQMGTEITRSMPQNLGTFDSTVDAWDRRVQSGQSGLYMSGQVSQFGRRRALEMFADWTDRIATGEVPEAPPRPQGLERNVVITHWDWGTSSEFVHDEIASDERDPTVNANGLIYGAMEFSADALLTLDPVRHVVSRVHLPLLDQANPPPLGWAREALQPSPYWGEEILWNSRSVPHNPMMDGKGRVWVTAAVRSSAAQPDWCQEGSSHPSAQLMPRARSGRQLAVYDPETGQVTPINLCFGTHHLEFAEDANDTLWFNAGGTAGWFSTKIWDETHDEQQAQGWIPFILDTNGNGRQDEYVGADDPVDPTKDKLAGSGAYDVAAAPDGTIWFSAAGYPGTIVRVSPGANPPATSLSEVYEVPLPGHTTRGIEVDRNGLAWVALGSGHLASFDRSKCAVLNGPTATGRHCPEGWMLHQDPGPRFRGTNNGADAHYLTWVDQFNTFGLGENVPFAIGNNSDSLLPMLPDGTFVVLRVPYPLGFMPKGMDGRIDDPDGGWKGRGVWSTYAGQPMWHIEGGKGQTAKVLKFQLRPDPLAK